MASQNLIAALFKRGGAQANRGDHAVLTNILCQLLQLVRRIRLKRLGVMAYLRLILFSAIVFVFHRWVSALYRSVLDYWHIYLLPVAALLACLMSYFFFGDVKETMTSIPLLFVMALSSILSAA